MFWFATPFFRNIVVCGLRLSKARFCCCTHRRDSRPRWTNLWTPLLFFQGSGAPPKLSSKPCPLTSQVLCFLNTSISLSTTPYSSEHGINVSWLFYKEESKEQGQLIVKLYGVFTLICITLDYAPKYCFHRVQSRDSRAVVRPSCNPSIIRKGITLP